MSNSLSEQRKVYRRKWYLGVPVQTQVSVHLIRAFVGPRHQRLENIWSRVAELVRPHGVAVIAHDNLQPTQLPHGEMLQKIWESEKDSPVPVTVFTEFDFLPILSGLQQPVFSGGRPISAATYCTRSPFGRRLVVHPGVPGAWWIAVDKARLGSDLQRLDFRAGGPGNDPAGRLPPDLTHLLGAEEGRLSPFGVVVPGAGEHLFFSRHYGDPPTRIVAGFVIGEIQRAVDRACDRYEKEIGL